MISLEGEVLCDDVEGGVASEVSMRGFFLVLRSFIVSSMER